MKTFVYVISLIVVWSLKLNAGSTGEAIAKGLSQLKGPATATVVVNQPRWIYTVTNNAPKDSGLTVNTFNFDLYGPAEAINVPKGWTVETDGKSFVGWLTEKNGLRPGESLKFELKSSSKEFQEAYAMIGTWNNKVNKSGPLSTAVLKIPKSSRP